MIVIADTSGVLSLFDHTGKDYEASRRAANAASLLVISPLALTEIHQVAVSRAGHKTADAIVNAITRQVAGLRMALADTTPGLLDTALNVRARYQDLRLDLVDSVNVALAEEYDTDAILTLDRRDFRVLRPLTNHAAFRLLPDDL
ncbi:PIN domain-containing protein [Streptomyces sp. TRM66268-LWL]|uniref:PIN domain-containing protein n=1 Tax=Streptomyces polyasparticus TaxID=2767826 RepID=A0ABR7SUU1_9ACTN|nr:PIN domain-containing protein [Streptomyces polyasparticus]MBC9719163.1 PIN domain-containing protein [Streptomyces polyasparticus]